MTVFLAGSSRRAEAGGGRPRSQAISFDRPHPAGRAPAPGARNASTTSTRNRQRPQAASMPALRPVELREEWHVELTGEVRRGLEGRALLDRAIARASDRCGLPLLDSCHEKSRQGRLRPPCRGSRSKCPDRPIWLAREPLSSQAPPAFGRRQVSEAPGMLLRMSVPSPCFLPVGSPLAGSVTDFTRVLLGG
jgi:hypothetical protein